MSERRTRQTYRSIRGRRLPFRSQRFSAGDFELVEPEAALLAGPGPAVRLQLLHPDDPTRFALIDLVWDRARSDSPGEPPPDILRFRGWTGRSDVRMHGEVYTPDLQALNLLPDPRSVAAWTLIDALEVPRAVELPPRPPGEPHLAVWVPASLAGPVREWVQALQFQRVPSELAAALASLLDGFFGEGGAPVVQRGLVQLRTALTQGSSVH